MKIYTVDEIMDASIPSGECKHVLQHLYQDIEHFTASSFYTKEENKPLVGSLCLAFSVLMAYAKGELVEKAEVLGVVEEMKNDVKLEDHPGLVHAEYSDSYDGDTLGELKRRIEALGGGK
jgi:hypothetical protein